LSRNPNMARTPRGALIGVETDCGNIAITEELTVGSRPLTHSRLLCSFCELLESDDLAHQIGCFFAARLTADQGNIPGGYKSDSVMTAEQTHNFAPVGMIRSLNHSFPPKLLGSR
jgi:hypothetical protein